MLKSLKNRRWLVGSGKIRLIGGLNRMFRMVVVTFRIDASALRIAHLDEEEIENAVDA